MRNGCSPLKFTARGNPRYVIHFFSCEPETWKESYNISARYSSTVKLMNKIGGRKYHNKQFGGGIVFQSYNITETIDHINKIKEGAK